MIIRFAEQVFFDLGQATLKPEALEIIDSLAQQLKDLPNPLRVEDILTTGPFAPAPFPQLGTQRASGRNVVRRLIEREASIS